MLKTSGYALGFQHYPRDLANVNEWKIMFDPYIVQGQNLATEGFYPVNHSITSLGQGLVKEKDLAAKVKQCNENLFNVPVNSFSDMSG